MQAFAGLGAVGVHGGNGHRDLLRKLDLGSNSAPFASHGIFHLFGMRLRTRLPSLTRIRRSCCPTRCWPISTASFAGSLVGACWAINLCTTSGQTFQTMTLGFEGIRCWRCLASAMCASQCACTGTGSLWGHRGIEFLISSALADMLISKWNPSVLMVLHGRGLHGPHRRRSKVLLARSWACAVEGQY